MLDPNSLPLSELWSRLVDETALRTLLRLARDEDVGPAGDVTSRVAIDAERGAAALVRARGPAVVAGLRALPVLVEVFEERGLFGRGVLVEPLVADGDAVEAGAAIVRLDGDLRGILVLERTLLNLLSRLCGVARATRALVAAVAGTEARICDTRKTTPGMRTLEKYAVRCGGGWLHRIGLSDAMLLKDNHLAGLAPDALPAWVASAAAAARAAADLRFVEVEVDHLEQLEALLALPEGTVDMVLLDNMDPAALRRAVALRGRRRTPLLEASGGISLATVRAVAESGVDRISSGAITHSAGIVDLGLDIEE